MRTEFILDSVARAGAFDAVARLTAMLVARSQFLVMRRTLAMLGGEESAWRELGRARGAALGNALELADNPRFAIPTMTLVHLQLLVRP